MRKCLLCLMAILAAVPFAFATIHMVSASTVQLPRPSAAAEFSMSSNPNLGSSSDPSYDEQIGITFTQNFTSIAYNVTAVAQSDTDGFGPAYLLNGLTDMGYWYQVGLEYNWPYLAGGGYNAGFYLGYEVFDRFGASIFPPTGGGGSISFSGPVNNGDSVLLSLSFSKGLVTMFAQDWNTGASASETYPANGTEFIGLSSLGNENGFFTGLMTEWYHQSPYYGGESPVNYTDASFAVSSGYAWADEYSAPNRSSTQFIQFQYFSFQNQSEIQIFSANGAVIHADAYSFTTGDLNQGLVTLSYSISAGGSGFLPPVLTYVYNGTVRFANATETPTTYLTDPGSPWNISRVLPGSSDNERWATNEQTSGTVSSLTTVNLKYFHQVEITFDYSITGEGTQYSPSPPTVRFVQFGITAEATAGTSFWADYRSAYLYLNPLQSSTNAEQWISSAPSAFVEGPGTIEVTYYHQFAVTMSYSLAGGGAPTPPSLSGTQFGSPLLLFLTTQPETVWLDSGTAWSVTNPLGGSNALQRWQSDSQTSGSVNGATTTSVRYYLQYSLTLSYSITGGGLPTGPSLNGVQFGQSFLSSISGTPTTYFLDSGSTWSVPNPLAGSTASERWVTAQTTKGMISEAAAVGLNYSRQFYMITTYEPQAGGTITNATGWQNVGTMVELSATANPGWKFEFWVGSGMGAYNGSMDDGTVYVGGPIRENATFYLGLEVVSGGNGAVRYNFGHGNLSVSVGKSETVYAPVGSVVELSASPASILYHFSGWAPTSSGSSSTITLTLRAPMTVEASFKLNLAIIGFIVVVLVTAVVVPVVVLRTRAIRRISGN